MKNTFKILSIITILLYLISNLGLEYTLHLIAFLICGYICVLSILSLIAGSEFVNYEKE